MKASSPNRSWNCIGASARGGRDAKTVVGADWRAQ
jgi:hypothetical protein